MSLQPPLPIPAYDPSLRGPHPVGVRTLRCADPARDGRTLPIELWFPASAEYRGRDLDPATSDSWVFGGRRCVQQAVREAVEAEGPHPLVVFSHHSLGHRRQSTRLCTHLASHGYIVAAVDHSGTTWRDQSTSFATDPDQARELMRRAATERPKDLTFVLDEIGTGMPAAGADLSRAGVMGHSMGGWTALTAVARDRRIRSVVAFAPGGARTFHEGDALRDWIELDWGREVPTLLVAAECDSQLPLEGMEELFERIRSPKQMLIVPGADHHHFCDDAARIHEGFRDVLRSARAAPGAAQLLARMRPARELCDEEEAIAAVRAATLAHFDASLRGVEPANRWLKRSLPKPTTPAGETGRLGR